MNSENYGMKNSNEQNLFNVIVSLFSELVKNCGFKYPIGVLVNNEENKFINLLLLIAVICSNFYFGECCPCNFNDIFCKIEEMRKEGIIDDHDELFFEYKESVKNIENIKINEKSEKSFSFQRTDERNDSSCSPLFPSIILDRIVANSDIENMMEICYSCDNSKIVEYIELMLTNPNILSAYFFQSQSSDICVQLLGGFVFGRKCAEYSFHNKMFFFFLFVVFFFIYL
jgi:hypothetical protein